jgi:RHS repeat-associated protein
MKKVLLWIILAMHMMVYTYAAGIVGTTKGKFTVENGSANYSLKIEVPPGIAGMAPKLSLNYNSNDGNGYMGVGWSIGGANVITRCPQSKAVDGANHKFGVKYDTNDRFCLDGQRLVVINGLPYGADGAEYRTEIDTYAKIKSVGTYGGGPRYFNVYTKSGLQYIYGAKGTTFQYTKFGGVMKIWSVDRIIDTYGNKIDFFYKTNSITGEHYLDKVTYAGNIVQYVYESRVDTMKGYQSGYPSLINKRLKNVIVKVGNSEVRRYTIAYINEPTGTRRSKLNSITENVAGSNLKKLLFSYTSSGRNSFANHVFKLASFGYNQGWRTNMHIRTMSDLNGDGLPDIVGFANGGVYVSLNTGNGNFSALSFKLASFGYNQGWRTNKHIRTMSDVNGDGLPDIVGFANGGVYVSLNNKKISHVSRITNNTDQDIKISYKNMTDPNVYYNYTQHRKRNAYAWNNIANDNIEMTTPMDLVYSVDRINAVGGYNQMRYKYYGYIYNKLRGSQGFHAIYTFDITSKMVDASYYKQISEPNGKGFQYTGMPYASYEGRLYDKTGSTYLKRTYITYKDSSSRSNTYEPYTYLNLQKISDPISQEPMKYIYNYNYVSTDGLGNVEKVVNKTQDVINNTNFYKTTLNEYSSEDTSKWHIGRLTKATVTHSGTGKSPITRTAIFTYNSRGVLNKEVSNVGTSVALTKTYGYDRHGNKIIERISGAGVKTATTHYAYSADGKFKTGVTNAEGLSESYTYDARFGLPLTHTGPNGLTTTWTYDAMGRKVEEHRADGTWTRWNYSWTSNSKMNTRSVFSTTQSSSVTPPRVTTYDSLGRVTQSYTQTLGGKKLFTAYKIYNAKAQIVNEKLPYIEGEGSVGSVVTSYDRYGRVVSVSKPGPSNTNQTYTTQINNFTTILTDPKGNQKQTVKNAIGQVLSITDAYGSSVASSIHYTYDAIGNLLKTTDSGGNVIRMAYNAAGKKVYMNDPDLGVWNYSYNALGKMTSQNNQKGQQTTIAYDILGRMTYKRVDEGTSFNETSYLYAGANASAGSKGKLLRTTNISALNGTDQHSQVKTMTYDTLGRPAQTLTTIGGRGDYLTKVSYDGYSRPLTLTYPNGYSVSNHYDPTTGILDAVTGSDGIVHYKIDQLNAFGSIKNATYGNGIHTLIAHDNAGYTGSIISYGASALLGGVQRLDYSYDALGNVVSRTDSSIAGKQILDTFGYDAMNRLVLQDTISDVIGNYEKHKVYNYDALGNMTFQTGIGAYTYYADKPHAVKQAGTRNYTYDTLGNMTNRNGDSIVYNPLNKPAILINHLNNKEVRFYYGVGGQRYMKRTANIDTYYLGKSYEERVEGSQETQICYITLGGKAIGTHTQVLNTDYVTTNPNYAETPFNRYFHTDALGSITAITDDNGTVVERRSYEPFGKIRAMDYGLSGTHAIIPINTVAQTTRAFTGHEQIAELSGLIHMNARVYDSDIGRFLSADPVLQAPLDSQSYNRYSYVRNNPLKFTDPTGNSWWTKLRNKITKPFKKAWHWVKKNSKFVLATIGAIVTGGFLAPLLLGAGGLGLTGIAYAASAGALAGAVSGAISTGTLKGALKGALFGAVTAGAAYGVADMTASVFNISNGAAHGASFLENGLTKVTAFKTLAHGLARGAINKFQGGSFKAGFMSGLSSGFDVGNTGYGNILGRTAIMAIGGGTFSVLGGGKFSNGAFAGAMTHLYNAEMRPRILGGITKEMKEKAKYYTKEARMARGLAIHQNMQEYSKPMMAAGVTGLAVLIGTPVVEAGYMYAMVNPISAYDFTVAMLDGGYSVSALGIVNWSGRTGEAIDLGIKWLTK